MSLSTLTTPEPTIAQPRLAEQSGGVGLAGRSRRDTPPPEPRTEKMRGVRLLAVWIGLTAGAWAVLGGAGYGLYAIVHSFLL